VLVSEECFVVLLFVWHVLMSEECFVVLPTVLTGNFIEDIQLCLVSYRINKLYMASVKHNNISNFQFSLF